MKIKLLLAIAFLVALSTASATTVAAQKRPILVLAEQYSTALHRFQTQKGRSSLQALVRKGKAVGADLDQLEDLSDEDFELLVKKMEGFAVNREEILFVEPEAKFFSDLARRKGTAADRAFFDLMRQLKPDDVWRAYIEPQTDVTGCTIYGDGSLTRLYGKARAFKQAYPRAYATEIQEEMAAIADEFRGNLCACGGKSSVIKEFELFIKSFPRVPHAREIRATLAEMRAKKAFRFNCHSG